jgi:hypothetical protein
MSAFDQSSTILPLAARKMVIRSGLAHQRFICFEIVSLVNL